ncbi:SRPBCC family protein [Janthinobacterium sp. 17J80-10]|uniref:SRPBCC family protein n=1 Tax=Janthinobacterium sp. 17J80-10 TaxID=2497863 RepID=UPI00100544BA|nr:SRPBCC family protein [Janthinobacterium sp. 17J80-10]QAU32858.1 DUF1857 family protein [Janthinobacterium sp. 17J80-10]
MKFHHLIEINDPKNPLVPFLSRAQLWYGLVLRAESPTLFMAHLDQCTLLDRTAEGVSRELRYGTLVIRDRVHFSPQVEVLYEVPAQGDIAASRMTMRIEEPTPEAFFVRFDYEEGSPDAHDAMTDFYNEFRRSAYHEADVETIRTIRRLAEEGRLDRLPS